MRLVLAHTSVWSREHQDVVARSLAGATRADLLSMTAPLLLELLRSSPSAARLQLDVARFDGLHQIETTPAVIRRARSVQAALAWRGYHRGPSAVDLLTAAAAESVDAELWHCDRHFELIAEVTGQRVRRIGT